MRKYTKKFKTQIAVKLLKTKKPKEICEKYSLPKGMIYRWLSEYKKTLEEEKNIKSENLKALKKENQILKLKLNLLYNSHCTPSSPDLDKLEAIKKFSNLIDIKNLCDFFKIHRNKYYRYLHEKKTYYELRDEMLTPLIIKSFHEHKARYGAKRIRYVLRKLGYIVSFQKVSKILKEHNLKALVGKPKRNSTNNNNETHDFLKNKYAIYAPDIVWTSDITEYTICDTKFYICAIEDLFSRYIISYKISTCNDLELLASTFNEAYKKRNNPNGLIFHSDNGSAYRSVRFAEYVKALGVKQSFSRIMHPKDNSYMESFFSTLKKEELHREDYKSPNEFLSAIDQYVEYYNNKRIHSKLGYATPFEIEHPSIFV